MKAIIDKEKRSVQVDYSLHNNQFQVFKDPSRFRVLVAGRRFGKTVLAVFELINSAFHKAGTVNWYCSPTYRQSKMIAWKLLLKYLHPALIQGKPNEVDLIVELKNGSEICLKGVDNENNLRGVGVHFMVLDEFAQYKENVWQEVLRPMLTDTKGRALFIGTPAGKNSFYELYLKGLRGEDGYKSFHFKTSDSPYIEKIEIDEARTQLNETYFRQEYEASFEDFVGLIYPEFNECHIIEPCDLGEVTKYVAIDPAVSGTTAALWGAVDRFGDWTIYDEYYEQNKRVNEVCEELSKRDIPSSYFIDPASRARNVQKEGKLYSIFDEYVDNGIICSLGENDVNSGINRVAEHFKANKIRIFKTCKNLIYELQRYHWSEERETVNGMSKPRPYKHLDHAADTLRYLINSRSIAYKKEEVFKPQRKSVAWYENRDNERKGKKIELCV